MGVVISDIPKIAFSQNEIAVTITSVDYLSSEGVAAVYVLSWPDITNPVEGNFIKLQFSNRSEIRLDVKDNPDNSGYQIPSQGILTRSEYCSILLEALRKNYILSSSYYIDFGEEDTIGFTARKSGTEFLITYMSDYYSFLVVASPVNNATKKNFQHYLEVWKGSEKLFESFLPLNYPISGKTDIDISSILHASLGLDIPDLLSVWKLCSKSVLHYTLKYANAWGEPSRVNAMETSVQRIAVLGGYSTMALAHISSTDHLEKYLLADPALYESQNWFESYPVDDVEVKTNQPQFLYFINSLTASENFRIKVECVFEDASIIQTVLNGGVLEPFQKACIAVGYKQLGLDALSTEENKIVSYAVQLISDNSPRTVAKRFIVHRCYEANTRYFLYAGSDGNFKTLRTYGSAEGNMDLAKETGVLQSTQSKRIEFGDVLTFDVVSYENEVVSTGYIMSRHSHEAVKEFLLTTRAFRVIGDKLIPIEITTKGMPLPSELNKTGFVKIEYRLAWDDRFFTGDTSALNVPSISQSQQALNDI